MRIANLARGVSNALVTALLVSAAWATGDEGDQAEETKKAKPCDQGTCKSSWISLDDATRAVVFELAEDYRRFIDVARTELLTVAETSALARAAGFMEWNGQDKPRPGDRLLVTNRHRSLALVVMGSASLRDGVRIAASHIDSPRIELKGRPLYEKEGFVLLQTNYHGGIKGFEWGNVPLALVGRLDKTDGSTVEISLGLDGDDPVFLIAGLAPHVSADLTKRSYDEVLEKEELDPIAGHLPNNDGEVKAAVLALLEESYGIGPADFVSAELSLVPATEPRDIGFDRALLGAYGQDDRASAYASVRALFDLETPPTTAIVYLADNEESGNNNNTGAGSTFVTDLVGDLLFAELGDAYREPMRAAALRSSVGLSLDVNPGINPLWPSAWEPGNAPRLGYGVNLKLYGRGFNARSEVLAWMRRLLDRDGIPWQTATYKVGKAGGGTLGGELSHYDMDVVDVGIAILSIHTPYAVSSKVDLHSLYRSVGAFFAAEPPPGSGE